jgi:hypothetical protein
MREWDVILERCGIPELKLLFAAAAEHSRPEVQEDQGQKQFEADREEEKKNGREGGGSVGGPQGSPGSANGS